MSNVKYVSHNKSAHLLTTEAPGGYAEHVALGGVLSDLLTVYPPNGAGSLSPEGHGTIEMRVFLSANLIEGHKTGITGPFS